jgi:hypothetical protein
MLKTHISRITLIAFIITTIMTGCNNAPISMTGIVEKVKANSTQARVRRSWRFFSYY